MIVSVVDLRYVLVGSVFVRFYFRTLDQFGGNQCVVISF